MKSQNFDPIAPYLEDQLKQYHVLQCEKIARASMIPLSAMPNSDRPSGKALIEASRELNKKTKSALEAAIEQTG